ncbi:unnamed protein product, partial [Symbiodinium sp. CCMP2456]
LRPDDQGPEWKQQLQSGHIEAPGIFRKLDLDPPERLGLPSMLGANALAVTQKVEDTLPKQDLDRRYGVGGWLPMRRFMLQQSNKLRGIDDGRSSGHNASCYAEETIYTSSPDFVGAAGKTCLHLLLQQGGDLPPWSAAVFGTADM